MRNARRAKRISGMQLAKEAGCTQSAISQFESGKLTALKHETVEKIAEILEVELPKATKEEPVETVTALPAKAAYCPNGACLSNVPYTVGSELILFPRKQPNPNATYCPWCGELLERECGECREPVTQTAFCPACGTKRIEPPADIYNPEEWAEKRRKEIAALETLLN